MPTQYNRLDDNGLLYLLQLLKPIIESAGEDNVIEVIQKNGVALTVQNKTVNIPVPTDLDIQTIVQSYNYQTEAQVQQLIDDELAGITGIEFEIVEELPATGQKGVIYLVGNSSPYTEYIWVEPTGASAHFEPIGSTDVDLSGYVQAVEMHALTNTEIDNIFSQVWTN